MKRVILLLAVISAWVGLARAEEPKPLKVLFVGNSLTGSNDLPGTVAALAKAGGKPFVQASSILPGRSLKEHWEDKRQRTLKKIQSEKWDIVVLQDYSSQPLDVPMDMVTYGKLFSKEIARQGAKTAWFITWAGRKRPKDQPTFTRAYADLSIATNGILVPAGAAWEWFDDKERTEFFPGSDQKHPSPAGTYLTACVFYGVFFHESPVGLPGKLDFLMPDGKQSPMDFDPAKAKKYQEAAWTAVQSAKPASPR